MDVVKIILHPMGLFKAAKGKRYYTLNKIDDYKNIMQH